jgi:hypothetical protein
MYEHEFNEIFSKDSKFRGMFYYNYGPDRTLLKGRTHEGYEFHVYKIDDMIHTLIFDKGGTVPDHKIEVEPHIVYHHELEKQFELHELKSVSVIHPELSDFDFCQRLRETFGDIPFAENYNTQRRLRFGPGPFYGTLLHDFVKDTQITECNPQMNTRPMG